MMWRGVSARSKVCSHSNRKLLRLYSSLHSDKVLRVIGSAGDYHIAVPYPGGRSVWFPITETDPARALKIGLQVEDTKVKQVNLLTLDGVRIASATPVSELLQSGFVLDLNGEKYTVISPQQTRAELVGANDPGKFQQIRTFLKEKEKDTDTVSMQEYMRKCEDLGINEQHAREMLLVLGDLGDVLHVSQNIELHDIIFLKPAKIISALEKTLDLERVKLSLEERVALLRSHKEELAPLEEILRNLQNKAEASASRIASGVLAGLTFQWFLFARFTWWDYDWDVMEPVTYFTTIVETVLAGFGWYLWTGSEYAHMDFRHMLIAMRLKREFKKNSFDDNKYKELKRQIAILEAEVKHLTE